MVFLLGKPCSNQTFGIDVLGLPASTKPYGLGWDGETEVQVLVPAANLRQGGDCRQGC